MDDLNKLPVSKRQVGRAYVFHLYKTALYLTLCACEMSVLHRDHVTSRQSAPGNNPQGRRSSGIVSLATWCRKKNPNHTSLNENYIVPCICLTAI